MALGADFDSYELGEFYPLHEVTSKQVRRAARSVIDVDGATAFVVSADGYVLTNAHVAHVIGELAIARMSVGHTMVILDRIEVRDDLDLAVYRIREDTQPWLEMRGYGPVKGEAVAVLGHPDGRPIEASFGTVLTMDATVDHTRSVEYSAQTWWGSSGSPVIDREGRAFAAHWGWDSEGRYHGRLLGVPLDLAAIELPILDSIQACPDPSELQMVAEPIAFEPPWHTFRLRLEGDPRCVERATGVTWHLHPTFEDPDVEIRKGDGFPLSIAVWGSFDMTATVDLDGREAEIEGRVQIR